MLTRLPPRWHTFVRQLLGGAIGVFAAIGVIAVYKGSAEPPPWWVVAGLGIGTALAAIYRDVPPDIVAANKKRAVGE